MGQVIGAEALLAELLGAADAFGDVLAGQLEMHPAGIAALGEMDREGAVQLVEDAVEDAGLVAVGRGDRVAVHRVDAPHDLAPLALHGADQRRQFGGDLVRPHPGDQREAPRLVLRVELVDQAQQIVGLERRPAFHPDRVLDPAARTRHGRRRPAGCGRRARPDGPSSRTSRRSSNRPGSSPPRRRGTAPRARCRTRSRGSAASSRN